MQLQKGVPPGEVSKVFECLLPCIWNQQGSIGRFDGTFNQVNGGGVIWGKQMRKYKATIRLIEHMNYKGRSSLNKRKPEKGSSYILIN